MKKLLLALNIALLTQSPLAFSGSCTADCADGSSQTCNSYGEREKCIAQDNVGCQVTSPCGKGTPGCSSTGVFVKEKKSCSK